MTALSPGVRDATILRLNAFPQNTAPEETLEQLIDRIAKMPRQGSSFALPTRAGSSDALLIASLASQIRSASLPAPAGSGEPTSARTLAVFTANAPDAQRLTEEIAFFAPKLTVRLLPDWETLPYDNFSPHQDLISERLDTLFGLHRC